MPYIGEPFDENYFTGSNPLGYTNIAFEEERHRAWANDIEQYTGLVSGKDVLEIGCAFGYLTDELALRGATVTGFDYSDYAIAQAQALFPTRHFVVGDIMSSGFTRNSFDLIVCCRTLECFDMTQTGAVLRELARIKRPQGSLYITVYSQHETYHCLSQAEWQSYASPLFPGQTINVYPVGDQPLSADLRIVVT